jgi:hypothetical protein
MSTTNNNIYTRNNLKWSPTEDKRLETLYTKQKLNFKAIATDLHRSVDAIQARFVKQYMAHKYSPKYMLENKEALANKYKIDNANFTRYLKYAGIKEEDIRKTRNNKKTSPTQKKVKYEIEEYNNDDIRSVVSDSSDSSDATWNPSEEDDDSSSCTSCSSYSSDSSSDSSDASSDTSSDTSGDEEDAEDHQYHIKKYIIQKQRERAQMQTDIANIMKCLQSLHEKIDRLDKKYK